ncbi:group I truncated hemoglobin [Limnobacter alexandrii]|jgi:hemoglobin|uniref:group I truncated hemoglobin n=1 Tax=Limnobacter alexandrii TaxID=2570352 RepID=UPI001FE50320|nr:group 1 truncated hemoglobin [Limnobacter alexandrii]
MMKSIRTNAAALAVAMCLSVSAQASSDKTLYEQLGGKESIRMVMDDFVVRLKADPRIGDQFAATNADRLASQLTDQVCEATGGPCKYVGADMKTAHEDMVITKAHFNALVEVLQTSMNAHSVPFDIQLEVLSMLAPMHRDVITVR